MKLYSNEIVFRGHPDKVCDQISDALLDAYLKEGPHIQDVVLRLWEEKVRFLLPVK